MSLVEYHITAEKVVDVSVTLQNPPSIELTTSTLPEVKIIAAGNVGVQGPPGLLGPPGPQGPQGEWLALTQAEYDSLTPKDPETLYVIVD